MNQKSYFHSLTTALGSLGFLYMLSATSFCEIFGAALGVLGTFLFIAILKFPESEAKKPFKAYWKCL